MIQPSPESNATQAVDATEKEAKEKLIDIGKISNGGATGGDGVTANEELKLDKKLRDYIISIVVIIAYIGFLGIMFCKGGFNDFTNFTIQKWVFSLGALVALITGLNFGYVNPLEKNFWAITDMLWVSMAVVSLSGFLNPVESIVLKGEVRTAEYTSESTRVLIANDISLAVKSMCATQSTIQQCKDWTIFSKTVDASHIEPRILYGRVKEMALPKLPLSPPTKIYRDAIEKNLESLKQSIEREQLAQSRIDDSNIGWAYCRMFLLMVALGLRAGKTGAELKNNPPKTPWKERLIIAKKFLRRKAS